MLVYTDSCTGKAGVVLVVADHSTSKTCGLSSRDDCHKQTYTMTCYHLITLVKCNLSQPGAHKEHEQERG